MRRVNRKFLYRSSIVLFFFACTEDEHISLTNPFDPNNSAFEQNYSIPPTSKIGVTFANVDGATGLGYKISTRYGSGANDYISETIPFPN